MPLKLKLCTKYIAPYEKVLHPIIQKVDLLDG